MQEEVTGASRVHRLPATPRTVHTGFYDNSLEPVLAVESGDRVSMETMMLLDGRLMPEITLDRLMELRASYRSQGYSSHSLTGSVHVNGAEPGDVLEIKILRLEPYPYAVTFNLPGDLGAGALPDEFPQGNVKGFRWRDGSTDIDFGYGVRLPLRPFLGSMAVAPATAGRVSGVTPGPYGGNLDLKELTAGATLYLPVFVPGALFSAGDAHAVQGDGEVSTSAAETAMKEALLQFTVRRDFRLDGPLAETPTHWVTMGFDTDLDEAARVALRGAIDWLVHNKQLRREDAYALCSLVVDLRVTQLVNREKGVHAMIPKAIFGD